MKRHANLPLLGFGILFLSISVHASVPVHQWSQGFGAIDNDSGRWVAVDPSGNVVVTGEFFDTVDFGGGDLTSAGVTDIFVAKYDAGGAHQWSRRIGSSMLDGESSVAVDASGNVILTGVFRDMVDFGGGNVTSAGCSDIFIAKYDAGGVHQWSQRFGGSNCEEVPIVTVDASGNVILVGRFRETVDFGGGNLVSAGGGDIVVAKYDASGVHQWSQRFGGTDLEGCRVVTDVSGNVIVTGFFFGTVDFGGGNLVSAGSRDAFVAKYDASGVHQWSQRFGDTVSDWGHSAVADASGNVIVVGKFVGTVDFGGGDLTSTGSFDIFVAKYDAGGVHQWSQRFGSTGRQIGRGIALDASDNLILTGTFDTPLDFGGGNLVSAGADDIFVVKFDASGVHQWSQGIGGTGYDNGYGVAVDASDNLILTGGFEDAVDFGGGDLVSVGAADVFVAKYSDETPLPVMFRAFEAEQRGGRIEVTWELWSDEALDRFTLYRTYGALSPVAIASGDAQTTRSYTDASVEPGATYDYELVIRTAGGDEFRSPVANVTVGRLAVSLSQNFPNPFNPQTTIEYTVSSQTTVSIEIFDASGALVARLDEGQREPGTYRAEWAGRDAAGRPVSSGIYFYRLAGVRGVDTHKMVLLK